MNVASCKSDFSAVELFKESLEKIKPDYWQFFAVAVVGMLIGSFTGGILFGPMICGIHIVYKRKLAGEDAEFTDLFKGFDYFVNSFVLIIINGLLAFAALLIMAIPFFLISWALGKIPGIGPLLVFLLLVVQYLLYVVVCMSAGYVGWFGCFMIVDNGLSATDALKSAVEGLKKNIVPLIILAVVSGIALVIGTACCLVGQLFVIPVVIAAYQGAYNLIFTESDDSTSDEEAQKPADSDSEEEKKEESSEDKKETKADDSEEASEDSELKDKPSDRCE